MATINLGAIKFNWQGAYAGGTAYAVDDVVSYNGSSYICKLASTGNLPTNNTYWDQMSSAGTNGTNGTDLTSTLTTQGDLVYRDGSGLQRLGAGTAGQVLQTGGAGANPSWGTVSSDYVKIASVTATGTASTVNFEYDFTPYKNIIVKYYDTYPSTQNSIEFRVAIGATPTYLSGASDYAVLGYGRYDNFSGANGSQSSSNQYNRIISSIGWAQNTGQSTTSFGSLEIYNVNSTSGLYKGYRVDGSASEAGGYRIIMNVGGWIQASASDAITGIQCLASGSNIYGIFNVYGVK